MNKLLSILCVFLAACTASAPPPSAGDPQVTGERVVFPKDSPQLKALQAVPAAVAQDELLTLNARLAWDEGRTVRVFAPLAGRVVHIAAEPGQGVKAGQTLATLSSPDFGQAQAEAARAAADYAVADKALARARELAQGGVIAGKDLQQAEADLARAQAERERTQARARLFGGGERVDQQFPLRAPLAGTVVERNANPGQEVRPDQAQPGAPALFVISDPSRLWVQMELPEAALAGVKPGMEFSLRTPALGDDSVRGRIEWIADSVDPATRTTRARGSVANASRRLKAEMFVGAELKLAQPAGRVHVPSGAVILLGSTQYVFIDEGEGRYRRQTVRAEEAGFGRMRLSEGVAVGDKVVTDGALLLQQILSGVGAAVVK